MKKYIFVLALFLSTNAVAFLDKDSVDDDNRICYGKAQIGFDFVKNSRLGVPPEDGVRLVGYGTPQAEFYLESILGAYLWKDTAHKYAEKIFASCLALK